MVVVSGLAFGIDACAHRGALDARPHDRRARLRRRRRLPGQPPLALAADLRSAAWSSPSCRPAPAPWRWTFPARNRIMAALAGMTVVVEAADRSGSLITADLAADLGRDLGAVPGPGQLARLRRAQRPARRRRLRRPRRPGRARRDARPGRTAARALRPAARARPARRSSPRSRRARRPATRSPPRSTSPAPRPPRPWPRLELLGYLDLLAARVSTRARCWPSPPTGRARLGCEPDELAERDTRRPLDRRLGLRRRRRHPGRPEGVRALRRARDDRDHRDHRAEHGRGRARSRRSRRR